MGSSDASAPAGGYVPCGTTVSVNEPSGKNGLPGREFSSSTGVGWCCGIRVKRLDRYFIVRFLTVYGEIMRGSVYVDYNVPYTSLLNM